MFSRLGAFALTILSLLMTSASAAQPSISLAPSEGVLVLRNGYVLSGRITPQGDYYLVTSGNSSEVRMPADQVEMVCRDIEQAYFVKRDRVNRTDIKAHLLLADWCLRQQLHARAADQILNCLAIDFGDPRITMLKRRLENAARAIQQSTAVTPTRATVIADDRLDQALDGLPFGAVKQFTESVQPVLLNRCATNACHGSAGKSELSLLRPRVGRILTHRMTQRNLLTTLKFVDRQSPRHSPLLAAPAAAHGGLPGPVFTATDSGPVTALIEWVTRVANGTQEPAPPQVASPDSVLSQASSRGPTWLDADDEPGVTATNDPLQPDSPAPIRSAPLGSRDPFDPDIFNRRHSRKPRPSHP